MLDGILTVWDFKICGTDFILTTIRTVIQLAACATVNAGFFIQNCIMALSHNAHFKSGVFTLVVK